MPERSARLAASRSTLVLKPRITAPLEDSADLTSFSLILPTLERIIFGRILSLVSFPSSSVMASRLPAVSVLMTRGRIETSFPTLECNWVGAPTLEEVGLAKESASSFFRNVLNFSPTAGILSQPIICTGLEKESSGTTFPSASRRKRIEAIVPVVAANKPGRTVPSLIIPTALIPLLASRLLSIMTPEPSASRSAVLSSSSEIRPIISKNSSTPLPVIADSSITGVLPP